MCIRDRHAAHRAEIASYQGDMTAAKMEAEIAGEHYANAAKIAALITSEFAVAERYRFAAETHALRASFAVVGVTTHEKEKLFLLR